MATIHGNWLCEETKEYFFIWGETWRNLDDEIMENNLINSKLKAENNPQIFHHPFHLSAEEIKESLVINSPFFKENLLIDKIMERWKNQTVYIPTHKINKKKKDYAYPLLSGQFIDLEIPENEIFLHSWQIEGFYLTPKETIKFLASLNLGELQNNHFWGEEISFWIHLHRWSLDLLARGKFIPSLLEEKLDKKIQSIWLPILDSFVDQTRLAKFTQQMPLICSSYWLNNHYLPVNPHYENKLDKLDNLKEPQSILLNYLSSIITSQLKDIIECNIPGNKELFTLPWLKALSKNNLAYFSLKDKEIKRLKNSLYNWTYPIKDYIPNPLTFQLKQTEFRTALKLLPPREIDINQKQFNWKLNYYLQAVDQEDLLIEARVIWQNPLNKLSYQGRIIENPQETLLKGLGLASHLYPPIAESLETTNPNYCELDPIQVYEFIRSITWLLKDSGLGVILPQGLESGTGEIRLGVNINAQITEKKGTRLGLKSILQYNLNLAVGDKILSQKDFQQLLDQKSPLVEIDEQWIALQPADVRAAQSILNQSHDKIELSVEDALRIATGDIKTLAKLPVVNFQTQGVLEELINAFLNNETIKILDTPKELNATLRPYQNRGFSWLSFLEKWGLGACLADDMGLGKTIQLISFLLKLKEEEILSNPVLIVCPTSVLNNWEREIKKFAPTLSVIIHHGDNRKKAKDFIKEVENKNIILTSYSLVFRDEKTLNLVDWQGIVLDEAQNIKNSQAKQSQAIRKIKAGFRIALTGTPVENRLSELWSILDFLNPGILGNRTFFQKRFAIPIEKYGDQHSLNSLRSLVQPFILRRLKTDQTIIQDLPEKQEMNVFCGLSNEQGELYQKLVNESLEKIEESTGIQRHGLILNLLLKLKQLCNHPALLLKENSLKDSHRSGKLLRLEEMLEELVLEGDRALIFTQFAQWGKLLQPYLAKKLGFNIPFLYGSTKRKERQEMIDRFQNDPQSPPIFILSLKAGGTGLNLTRANHVFHIDRWWNPAVENQATDRAFRIGQKCNVQVHKFICSGTLEEKINDMIESKKQLAQQTVDAGENWLTQMDTDQLRNLLLLNSETIMDDD
jgi:SNF2 family DNA or RNA helicase